MKWFKRKTPSLLAYNIIWFNQSSWLERLWAYGLIKNYYWHGETDLNKQQ